jgi:hypothetical protein
VKPVDADAGVAVSAAPARRRAGIGLLLLSLALLFNAILLAPELRIGRLPLNDIVLHRAASERLLASFERGEPLLDAWVSEWSLGYPLWRSYQPLPHAIGALWLAATQHWVLHDDAFAVLVYALLVLLPASVYGGGRRLGLSPPAAGLAASPAAPSGPANLDSPAQPRRAGGAAPGFHPAGGAAFPRLGAGKRAARAR